MLACIYQDEQGVIDKVVLTATGVEESKELIALAEKYKPKPEVAGSGSARWPEGEGWTNAGDGTDYPAVPTQAEADAVAEQARAEEARDASPVPPAVEAPTV